MIVLIITGALGVTFLFAYLIVKFVPLKLRWLVSILLLIASAYLVYLIYNGVMEPIKFDIEKRKRYSKVVSNLKLIRDAQVKYNEATGIFTKDKNKLINFIENDSLVLTETVNEKKTITLSGGITKDISIKKIDTIGYESVLRYFKDKDYKNMFTVPDTGKEFEIGIGEIEKITGLFVPVFEAKTDKESILKGLPRHLIKQELEVIESDQIKGQFVSVGSLEEVSTGGNWPPLYDKSDAKTNTKEQ